MAWYVADYGSWVQYGQNMNIMLRAAANTAASGESVCGRNLYGAPRVRNLVYCPPLSGVNYVRFERTSPDYLYVTEVEVFRGGALAIMHRARHKRGGAGRGNAGYADMQDMDKGASIFTNNLVAPCSTWQHTRLYSWKDCLRGLALRARFCVAQASCALA